MNPKLSFVSSLVLGGSSLVLGGLVLALTSATLVHAAPAAAPSAAGVEAMPPTRYTARHDDVPVRSEPGFVYRETKRLARGEAIVVDGRKDEWLRVASGGWVAADDVWTKDQADAAPKGKVLVVIKDGARVRATPSVDGALVDTLKADSLVNATLQQGDWWQLDTGGWINASLVRSQDGSPLAAAAAKASTPDRPLPWVVASDSANVRSERKADAPITKRLARGDIVVVSRVIDGWAEVPSGWVRQEFLQPPDPRPPGGKGQAPEVDPRRWSYMDLNGVIFEVYELADQGLVEHIKERMRDAKDLEPDWTFMGITIGVPSDATFMFKYAPDVNKVALADVQGEKYGNVYARGPLDRMPADLREALGPHDIAAGEKFSGLLLFRPTLKVRNISNVSMLVSGRPQTLIRAK